MMRIFLFVLSLFLSHCYASDTWQTPAVGSQEEQEIIKKSARVNFTFRSGWKYHHELSSFLDRHFESILTKIQNEVEERAEVLENTDYVALIPQLASYKTIERWNYAKHKTLEQPVQQNQNLWQSIASFFCKQTKKLQSDRIKTQLYHYTQCDNAIKIAEKEEVYLVGVAQRMQLYAKLYNALSRREIRDCTCSDHYFLDLCYLPVLQAELLADICLSLQVQQNKTVPEDKKTDISKTYEMQKLLAKVTQEELQDTKNWNYTPPLNNIADFSKHLSFIGCESNNSMRGPCVLSPSYCHPIKYLPRDMTSGVKKIEGHGRSDVPVISSRQMWTSRDQTEKRRYEERSNQRIRFSDDDWGYDVFLELPFRSKYDDFKIVASHWSSNESMNKCVFTYERKYWVWVEDLKKREERSRYGIRFIDLPSWNTREYGIQFHPTYSYEDDELPNGMVKGLHQKSYDVTFDDSHFMQTPDAVTAVVYNKYREEVFCGHGREFKKAYFGLSEAAASQQLSFHTFPQPIKKIFAFDAWTHLIVTVDNKIYAYYGFNDQTLKKVEDFTDTLASLLPNDKIVILDVAFDDTRNQLALLTNVGVYTVCLKMQNPPQDVDLNTELTSTQIETMLAPRGPYEYEKEKYTFPSLATPHDIKDWNLKLSTMELVPHESFKYKKYGYNAIDFQNGQIYVMKKGRRNYSGEDPVVLIYPPLSPDLEVAQAPTTTAAAIPSSSSSSSSSSSTADQGRDLGHELTMTERAEMVQRDGKVWVELARAGYNLSALLELDQKKFWKVLEEARRAANDSI